MATNVISETKLTREELLWLILRTPELKAKHTVLVGTTTQNESFVKIDEVPEHWDLENPNVSRATEELLAAVNKFIAIYRLSTELND